MLLERREFFKLALLAAINTQELFAQPFLWTKEEILFGPYAGFKEARVGIPLGIYTQDVELTIIEAGVAAWNNLAREIGRNDLFYIENNPSKAKIVVVPGRRFRVTAYPDYTSPYEKCRIELNIDLLNIFTHERPRVVTHELGHTLGFVDFLPAATNLTGYVNPQRCDLPDKPILSIMADNSRWFGEHDPRMLALAGYGK